MNTQEIINYMHKHPWAITQGARKLAEELHSNINDVVEARNCILRERGKRPRNKLHLSNLQDNKSFPKILIFDIETSPMKAYVWKRWKENVSLDLTISEWFCICWSAKWLYSTEVLGECLTPEEILKEDDSRIVKSLWNLFNEADIVVAHNGIKFDVPKMNSRFIVNGLKPTTPYHIIDTLLVAKKLFGFSSNKLDALAEYFGFEHKLDTDFNLWKECLEGNQEALDYMLKYNKRDVTLLEEVYLKLRPWIKAHPNVSNYLELSIPTCSNCGSLNVKPIENAYYYTSVGKYQLYKCECGCISRGRTSLKENKVNNTSVGH